MYKESIDESKAAIRHFDGSSTRIALLGYSYAVAGKNLEALQVLRRLDSFRDQYVSPHTRALIYRGLGQRDQAFPYLEKAYQDRNWTMTANCTRQLRHLASVLVAKRFVQLP